MMILILIITSDNNDINNNHNNDNNDNNNTNNNHSNTRTPTGACTSRAHFDLPAGQVPFTKPPFVNSRMLTCLPFPLYVSPPRTPE